MMPEIARSRLLETAKKIIDGNLGLLEGVHEIVETLSFTGVDREDPMFDVFRAVDSEVDHLPIGTQRSYWNAEALKEKDVIIADYERFYRDAIIEASEKIVDSLK